MSPMASVRSMKSSSKSLVLKSSLTMPFMKACQPEAVLGVLSSFTASASVLTNFLKAAAALIPFPSMLLYGRTSPPASS